jgi:MFS family permease
VEANHRRLQRPNVAIELRRKREYKLLISWGTKYTDVVMQVMTYYVVYIFGMAGLSKNVNLISSGVQYALFIVGTAIMFFYVDKVGRRPLLIHGAIAMGICHFVVGGVLSTGTYVPDGVDGNPNIKILVGGSAGNTVIAFCYLLILFYSLTLAPVCWIYAAEVWSLETRATGMGIAAIGNWVSQID